jgi:hypothetical protein
MIYQMHCTLKAALSLAIVALLFVGLSTPGHAQGRQHIIQFSGIVLGGEESLPLVGANLYIPKAGRGTTTNEYGFFSMPTLAGDSVIISAIGFKKRFYKIPETMEDGYSVVIELLADTTMLPVVEVYPYPTEELFKEAFLALELPDEKDQQAMRRNLNEQLMARMVYESGMSGYENFRNYNNQQVYLNANRYFNPTFQFLNPFAWAQFIKSVKRGDLKKKSWQK